jgi:hypothetical protein
MGSARDVVLLILDREEKAYVYSKNKDIINNDYFWYVDSELFFNKTSKHS